MDKLKHCPFCGEEAGIYGGGLSQETEIVCCRCCGAQTNGYKPVDKWNSRIDMDYPLPCDVALPPSTTLKKGVPLSTLITALRRRE